MGSLTRGIAKFFFGSSERKSRRVAKPPVEATSAPYSIERPAPRITARIPVRPSPRPSRSAASRARVVNTDVCRAPIAYWELRRWRYKGNGVYLGYFKTPLGRCHGVIKWIDCDDFNFYVHDVPLSILAGPHGGCFTEVRPGKFQVHFAEWPEDINSGIFYIETLLMEAFTDG